MVSFLTAMEAEVPQVPAARKKEPSRRAAAQKKPLASFTEISDDDEDDEDFEVEEVSASDAKKKGGRRPAANAKAAAAKPAAAAAKNKRGAANKQQPQLLGQTLLTEIFKPAETLGISPEKKVRKMRASPFNKKSGSVLGSTEEEDETAETEENSGSASTSNSSGGESNEVVMPARTRPQRVNRVQTRYVVSDSESDQPTDDSDFAGEDD